MLLAKPPGFRERRRIGVTISVSVSGYRSMVYGCVPPAVLPCVPRRPVLDMRTFGNTRQAGRCLITSRVDPQPTIAHIEEGLTGRGWRDGCLRRRPQGPGPRQHGHGGIAVGGVIPVDAGRSHSATGAGSLEAAPSGNRSRSRARPPRTTRTTLQDAHGLRFVVVTDRRDLPSDKSRCQRRPQGQRASAARPSSAPGPACPRPKTPRDGERPSAISADTAPAQPPR